MIVSLPVNPCSSRNRSKIRLAVCRCFFSWLWSSSRIWSMIGRKGSSFGRTGGFDRRYPGGTGMLQHLPDCLAVDVEHSRRFALDSSSRRGTPGAPDCTDPRNTSLRLQLVASGERCGISLRDGQTNCPFTLSNLTPGFTPLGHLRGQLHARAASLPQFRRVAHRYRMVVPFCASHAMRAGLIRTGGNGAEPLQIARSRRGFQNGRKSSIFGQRSITTFSPASSASFAARSS